MPDVWTIVKENSSLASGDFWEHLNNQEGGTSTGLVLIDGLEVLMAEDKLEVLLDISEVTAELADNLEVLVDFPEYDVEVS